MGEIAQGPRRAADTGLDPVSVRLSTDTIGPVWWKSGCRKRAYGICKYGEQAKSPYESMTLIRKIKKGFWQLLSIIKNRNFSLLFFLHFNPNKNSIFAISVRITLKNTDLYSVFAVGAASQFWTNCKHTGNNVHERLRFAWAWFRCMCKGVQTREAVAWISPRILFASTHPNMDRPSFGPADSGAEWAS